MKSLRTVLHKIVAWISLSLNITIASIIHANLIDSNRFIFRGLVLGVICLLLGFLKIYRDINVKDSSGASVVISYVGTFLLSVIYIVYLQTSIKVLLSLALITMIECSIALLISRRH